MCDSLCNKQIPKSSNTIIVIRPSRSTFVTGLARQYCDKFPAELKGVLSQKDFEIIMEQINDTLFVYFPCTLCWGFGYLCCPFTLGLSLCCPAICVSDAQKHVKQVIARINRVKLQPLGIKMSLKKGCMTSWLEIALLRTKEAEAEMLI